MKEKGQEVLLERERDCVTLRTDRVYEQLNVSRMSGQRRLAEWARGRQRFKGHSPRYTPIVLHKLLPQQLLPRRAPSSPSSPTTPNCRRTY